ncbi:hypothetical protein ACT3TB_01210 [Micrococcaceae sp. AOP34-BR2-30]|uniref:hypothetical protein n=1 Tax=Brachybacterium alimentarium TaxID=47845 RepID=UPI003FD36A95
MPRYDHPQLDAELTLPEAAATRRYGSYSTLRNRIHCGQLPYIRKDGRSYLVRVADLEALRAPESKAAVDAAIERIVSAAPHLTAKQLSRLAPAFVPAEVAQR